MRKLVLLVVAVALIGGYTVYWHKKADEFKDMVEKSITTFNEQAKSAADIPVIHYESIQISGFPFSMTLEIIKPVINLPVSELAKKIVQPAPLTPGQVVPPAIDWSEEISYGDKVSLSGNLLGSRFTLSMAGDRTDKSYIDHVLKHTLVSSSSSPLVCHLKVERPVNGSMWTMQPMFTDPQTFMAIFREADCATGEHSIKDAANGTLLFSSDALSVATSNEPTARTDRKITFKVLQKNAKASAALDPIAADYITWFENVAKLPTQQRVIILPLSQYGEQNTNIDVRYEGPTERAHLLDPAAQLHLDVNAFDMKNALFDIAFEAHINSAPEGNDRTASVVVHGRSEVAELYDQLMIKQTAATMAQASLLGKQAGLPAHTPEEAAAILPRMHDLGKVTLEVNTNVKGPNQPDKFLKHAIYTLDAADWVATPYGIKAKGGANLSAEGKLPSGELTVTCLSCDALVSSFGDYLSRVIKYSVPAPQAGQPQQPPLITPALLEGVKKFLHDIAENSDKNTKDLVIHLLMKDTGEFTVSGKQVNDLMRLFSTDVNPYLPQSAPPPVQQPIMQAPPAPAKK